MDGLNRLLLKFEFCNALGLLSSVGTDTEPSPLREREKRRVAWYYWYLRSVEGWHPFQIGRQYAQEFSIASITHALLQYSTTWRETRSSVFFFPTRQPYPFSIGR
jgi:hypothetical protein